MVPYAFECGDLKLPSTDCTGVTHDRIACPFTITVHDPHWPYPQPNFAPRSPRVVAQDVKQRGRRINVKRMSFWPFTFNVIGSHISPPYCESEDFVKSGCPKGVPAECGEPALASNAAPLGVMNSGSDDIAKASGRPNRSLVGSSRRWAFGASTCGAARQFFFVLPEYWPPLFLWLQIHEGTPC